MAGSPLQAEYGTAVDRESAYERLTAKLAPPPPPAAPAAPRPGPGPRKAPTPPRREPEGGFGGLMSSVLGSSAAESFARSAASALGREITRGMLGTAKKRRR